MLEVLLALVMAVVLAALLALGAKGIVRKVDASSCATRLREVGIGIHLYAADHANTLPGPMTSQSFFAVYRDQPDHPAGLNGLFYHIWPYLGLSPAGSRARLARVGVCPAAERGKSESYLANSKFFTTVVHNSNSRPGIPYPHRNELPSETASFGRSYPLGYYSERNGIRLLPWKTAVVPFPGRFALLGELPGSVKNTNWYHSSEHPPDPASHCNFLFLDGHVETRFQRDFIQP